MKTVIGAVLVQHCRSFVIKMPKYGSRNISRFELQERYFAFFRDLNGAPEAKTLHSRHGEGYKKKVSFTQESSSGTGNHSRAHDTKVH